MSIQVRSVLVATDLSTPTNDVLRAAAALAAHTGAELHVVHAIEPARGVGSDEVLETQRKIHDARIALMTQVENSIPQQVQVSSSHVAFEQAPAAILERATEVAADLIIVGPHRPRSFGDRVLGTTADRILTKSRIPCLLARGELTPPLRRIIVPTDLTEASSRSLAVALEWSEVLQGSMASADAGAVSILHVDETAGADRADETTAESRPELDASVGAALEAMAPRQPQVRTVVRRGSTPADEILRFAEETDADLLIMGTRGDRPIVKALLGSVSATVARNGDIPLLLIPPPAWSGKEDTPPNPVLSEPPRVPPTAW
jgi:nucleotide-binding universal stress UspA family protein